MTSDPSVLEEEKEREDNKKKLLRFSLGLFSTGCLVSELGAPTAV